MPRFMIHSSGGICDIDEKTYGVRVLLAVRMEMARAVREGGRRVSRPSKRFDLYTRFYSLADFQNSHSKVLLFTTVT